MAISKEIPNPIADALARELDGRDVLSSAQAYVMVGVAMVSAIENQTRVLKHLEDVVSLHFMHTK